MDPIQTDSETGEEDVDDDDQNLRIKRRKVMVINTNQNVSFSRMKLASYGMARKFLILFKIVSIEQYHIIYFKKNLFSYLKSLFRPVVVENDEAKI